MEKTPKQLRAEAAALLKQADKIEQVSKKQQPSRPKPKIPDEDPEAQALIREKYRIGHTFAGAPLTKEQIKKLTGDEE